MPYCAKCGRRIQADARFCPYCAAPVRARQQKRPAESLRGVKREMDATPDYSERYQRADIRRNRTMAMLAYGSVLIFVPMLLARRSYFARFHVNQAVLPNAVGLALVALAVLLAPKAAFFGWFFAILDLPVIALRALGFCNARNGRAKELPFVGKFRFFQ